MERHRIGPLVELVDTKPQQEGRNAVTDSEVQGVEGEDYAWL